MGAAAFGYGIFQLTSSLLPAKLLKIISIFGFEGNRDLGISCLMFARTSTDMRAILSTYGNEQFPQKFEIQLNRKFNDGYDFFLFLCSLALLWFYTFGTQLFRNEDAYASDKIDAVANLLNECRDNYHDSAIFLFFHGRLERMKVRT